MLSCTTAAYFADTHYSPVSLFFAQSGKIDIYQIKYAQGFIIYFPACAKVCQIDGDWRIGGQKCL
jgi:hypothetical protein